MKISKATLALALAAFVPTYTAFGAVIDSVDTTITIENNSVKQMVTITGSDVKSDSVNIEIVNPGKTPADFPAQSFDTVFNHVKQYNVDNDGNYTYTFKMKGATGQYKLRANADTALELDFYFTNDNEVLTAFQNLNQGSTADDVKTVVLSIPEVFNEGIQELQIADMTYIYAQMAKNIPFADISEAIDLYQRLCVIDVLNHTAQPDNYLQLFVKYNDLMGIKDMAAYPTYVEYSGITDKVQKDLIGKNIDSYENFIMLFNERVILRAIESVSSPQSVSDILIANDNVLKFDYSKYNKLKDNVQPFKELRGNLYGSIESLKDAFATAVDTQYNKENNVKNNAGVSSGGGGGGGGSMSAAYTKTPVKSDLPVEIAKPSASRFNDLDGFLWAKESIEALVDLGAVNGYEDGTFRPTENITREQFVKMAISAFSLLDKNATCDFNDVNSNDWFYSYVASAKNKGIINGIDDKAFGTGRMITREELATILVRVVNISGKQLPEICEKIVFADENDMSFGAESIYTLQRAGVVNGMGDGQFMPKENCTRAEAAKMLYGVLSSI